MFQNIFQKFQKNKKNNYGEGFNILYISLTLNSYSRDENCFKYNKKKQFKPKMFALVNFPSVEKH